MKKLFRLMMLGMVLLTGCSSSTGVVGKATVNPITLLPTITPTPTPVTANLTPLSMHDAWGDVHISQFSLDMGNQFFGPRPPYNGITDDDQVCGSTIPMNNTTAAPHFISSIGLLNLHTGQISLLASMSAGVNIWGCTVTGPWLVWTEISGNTFGSWAATWVIKAINRDTGEIRILDQAKASTAQNPVASIRPQPYASNGRIVWTTYSEDTPKDTQSEMYTFATGAKTVLADHTSYPILSWPWVAWGDGKQKAIVCTNLETEQQVLLHMKYAPTTVAFQGTTFVYTNSDYSNVLMYPDITDPALPHYVIEDKAVDGDGFSEFPSLNSRLISWASNTTSLLFDRKLMRQVQVASAIPFAGDIASHFLISTTPLTAADRDASVKGLPYHHVIRIIDTSTLP